MLFNKSEDDLKKFQGPIQRIETEINKDPNAKKFELPIVIFAVGANGSCVLIDNPNSDKIGIGVDEMLKEEFDGDLEFDELPGVYSAEFNWLTIKDAYNGDYDCELIVNDMVCIWKYKKE